MSFLAEGVRRDETAPGEVTTGSASGSGAGAADGLAPRLRAIGGEDPRGSAAAPWTQRRLNEALAELGPVRPGLLGGESPSDAVAPAAHSTLAEAAIAAAAALSRHSPLLAQATLAPPPQDMTGFALRSPDAPIPAPPKSFEARGDGSAPAADASETFTPHSSAMELAIDASQIVRALAESCDRETFGPVPPPAAHQRAAVPPPPLPPPPAVHARVIAVASSESTEGDLVPSWMVVPPPTQASLLIDHEAGERPPMIIERAIAEAEQAASEAAGAARAGRGRQAMPSAWPPMAAGFGLALATGAVLYAILIAG